LEKRQYQYKKTEFLCNIKLGSIAGTWCSRWSNVYFFFYPCSCYHSMMNYKCQRCFNTQN